MKISKILSELVKFPKCAGIKLDHVSYLLTYAKRIRSVYIDFIALKNNMQEQIIVEEIVIENV